MKYLVTIDGTEREIDVQISPGGVIVASLEGQPLDGDVVPVPGGVNLRIDGKLYDVMIGGTAEKMNLAQGTNRALAKVESERVLARKKKSGASAGNDKELRAPMPGRVVKILVAEGEDTTPGQPLIVIEAMKMENELRATGPGKVAGIEVKEGQTVESSALLLRFE